MKQLILLFILLTLSLQSVEAQEAVLVSDYNPGTESAFSNWNYQTHSIGDNLLVPIIHPDHGEELGIISNGELSLLKDLVTGEASSGPKGFYTYKDKTYFSAKNANADFELWETDGTEAGTVLSFDIGQTYNEATNFIESASGWLYFKFAGNQFRTDGSAVENLGEADYFDFSNTTTGAQSYKDEIAFISEGSGTAIITKVNADGSYEVLLEQETAFSADIEGFMVLGDYFIWEIYTFGSGDLAGLYYWKEGQAEPSKFDISAPSRYLDLGNDKIVATTFRDGIYSFEPGTNEVVVNKVWEGDPETYTQESPLISVVHKGKALYVGEDGFPDNAIFLTDISTLETKTDFILEPYTSDFLLHNNYAFLASGTSNGFEPIIHYYDFKNSQSGNVKEFIESSNQTNSIRFVGVQDSKLYFISNLIPETGAELYYIDITNLEGLNVNVKDTQATEINLSVLENGFKVESSELSEFQFRISDLSGRLLEKGTGQVNEVYSLNKYSDMVTITIITKDQQATKLAFLN